jgi:hypothetical protein
VTASSAVKIDVDNTKASLGSRIFRGSERSISSYLRGVQLRQGTVIAP